MKAFVIFSPIDDEEKAEGKTIDTLKQTAVESAAKTVENMLAVPEDINRTRIAILPVFLEGLEFVKGTEEVTPLVLFTEESKEKQKDPLFGDRFRYMQFVDGASVKLTGKIVTLSIKSGSETEEEQGIFRGILDYNKMGKEEQLLFRQKTGKAIVEYLANLTAINSLNDWAISEKQSLEKSGKPGEGGIDPVVIGTGKEKDTVLGDKAKKERDPSEAVSAYTKIKKSMLVLYFNDYEAEDYELKTNSDDWDSSKTAKEVHERERAEMMLSNINKSISETEEKIKELQKEMKQKEFEKNTAINEINTIEPDSEIAVSEAEKKLLEEETNMSEAEKNVLNTEIGILNGEIGLLNPSDEKEKEIIKVLDEKIQKNKKIIEELDGNIEKNKKTIKELDEKIKFANDVRNNKSKMISDKEDKYDKYNSAAQAKLDRLEREQHRLIEERKPIKEDTEKAQKEYKSKDKQQKLRDYIESILGINIGIPIRYMYIPETQIVSYAESMTLSSSSEGMFQLIVKQVPGSQKPVEVGNPVTGGFRVLKKMLGGMFKDFGGGSGAADDKKNKS